MNIKICLNKKQDKFLENKTLLGTNNINIFLNGKNFDLKILKYKNIKFYIEDIVKINDIYNIILNIDFISYYSYILNKLNKTFNFNNDLNKKILHIIIQEHKNINWKKIENKSTFLDKEGFYNV